MKKDDCIFCKIAAGEIPSATVYEDDDFRAILDLGPAVISKTANAIKEALGCDGINVVQNNGEAAGQTVMHLHFHIIPRYKNDSVNIGWQPMKPSNEELAATADLIKEKMN